FPVPAGEPDQGEAGRQQAPVGQVVDGRHQLLAGQVTGDPEQHQDTRAGHPGDAPGPRVAPRGRRAHPPAPVTRTAALRPATGPPGPPTGGCFPAPGSVIAAPAPLESSRAIPARTRRTSTRPLPRAP